MAIVKHNLRECAITSSSACVLSITTADTMQRMSLGERLIKARKDAGLNQEQLGDAVGISRQAISQIETGDTKDLGVIRVAELAEVLKVKPCWLAFGAADTRIDPDILEYVVASVINAAHRRNVPINHPKLATLIAALYESELDQAGTLPDQIKRMFQLIT